MAPIATYTLLFTPLPYIVIYPFTLREPRASPCGRDTPLAVPSGVAAISFQRMPSERGEASPERVTSLSHCQVSVDEHPFQKGVS